MNISIMDNRLGHPNTSMLGSGKASVFIIDKSACTIKIVTNYGYEVNITISSGELTELINELQR